MKDITDKNFGVIIAFLLPGFIFIWNLSFSWPEIALWLRSTEPTGATVGNFLYATLASLAAGLLISAIRWFFVDSLLSLCGNQVRGLSSLKRPPLDLSRLADKDVFTAYNGAVENHYRYYQYYSNTLVSVVIGFVAYETTANERRSGLTVYFLLVSIILLFASGDLLSKYYAAASQILSSSNRGGSA